MYEKLRTHILDGSLQPDEKLRVNDIARRYGCGSFPVREALNRLAAEGLAIYSDQRGFAVAPISREELEDIGRTRSWIVGLAIEKAVLLGDAQWEEDVLLSYHRLSKTPRYLDIEARELNPEYDTVHRQFHTTLISGCGSKKLVEICEDLFNHSERYRTLSRAVAPRSREDEHKLIVDAVLARQVDEAVRLSVAHIQATAKRALENLT